MLPELSYVYAPLLVMVQSTHWPAAYDPWIMAAQVEKETCISLTHKKCWSPKAELKTARENGIGFGQITRAYNEDGSIRFDKQAELRAKYSSDLKDWTWENRYNPMLQLNGLVLMDKSGFSRFKPLAATPLDTWAFTLSGYNGGDGSVMKDRLLCEKKPGCDKTKWFGNVELYSTKSKTKWKGYGQSPYEINREYPRRILKRAPEYKGFWK